ncbi:hypothetical protein NDU88_002184 [Pleurodeles waltl]|uniref:Uncharacterized protein n=1 Tax=Pleurodeles waltl TaxID=8319 RepID=A0AAV7NGX8_PLEWA|nr:hypothetical protein NDU88_002184 [Pleurodeles waltl]
MAESGVRSTAAPAHIPRMQVHFVRSLSRCCTLEIVRPAAASWKLLPEVPGKEGSEAATSSELAGSGAAETPPRPYKATPRRETGERASPVVASSTPRVDTAFVRRRRREALCLVLPGAVDAQPPFPHRGSPDHSKCGGRRQGAGLALSARDSGRCSGDEAGPGLPLATFEESARILAPGSAPEKPLSTTCIYL